MSHLYVIVDCCPSPFVNQRQYMKWLDSIVTFCNSHLMVDEKNELTVIASYVNKNKLVLSTTKGLKPAKAIIPQTGQFEKFAFTTDIMRTEIADLVRTQQQITNQQPQSGAGDCALAGAIGTVLCRIKSATKTNTTKTTQNNNNSNLSHSQRILVVSCSIQAASFASQYMNLMNGFFAAQKMNIPIDGCIYMKEESKRGSVLEQGCDLTGGHYLNLPDIAGNLEYLLWIFLPSTSIREKILLPEQRKANHRAVCFCHRNIIEIGYVCSVCLSIFCSFSPICSSCQTHFKLDLSPKVISRKNTTTSQNSTEP